MVKPYYDDGQGIQIYLGDCREILPHLPKVDLVLTDPPYGIDIGGSGSIGGSGMVHVKDYGISDWDKRGMNMQEWMLIRARTEQWIVWGGNHLCDVIGPSPGVLVWDKKCQNDWNDTFSEMEMAWTNLLTRTKGYRHLWAGALRASEQGANVRQHPTQKPVALLTWCLGFAPDAMTILDPFMGSGTTLRAAKDLGRKCIGIEIEEKYCEIAVRRLAQTVLPL